MRKFICAKVACLWLLVLILIFCPVKSVFAEEEEDTSTEMMVETPQMLSVTNVKDGLEIKWQEVSADRYILYKRLSGEEDYHSIGSVYECRYTDTEVSPGKTYFYKIRAVLGDERSSRSAGMACRRLTEVNNLKLKNLTAGIKLTFSRVKGATGYRIYRREKSGEKFALYMTVKGETSFTDAEVTHGQNYSYRVSAFYETSSGKRYVGVSSEKMTIRRLERPTITSIKAYAGKLKVVCEKEKKITGYQYQYDLSSDFSQAMTMTGSSEEKILKDLLGDSNYYVRVRSYYTNSQGKKSYSPWSAKKHQVTGRYKSDTIRIVDTSITLGQSVNTLGDPDEILRSTFGFSWYVYGSDDYQKFYAVGVNSKENVRAVLTAGTGFFYQGMICGDPLSDYSNDDCFVYIGTDKNDHKAIHCVMIADQANVTSFTEEALRGESKMMFHLTNAFRVSHGECVLEWENRAAKAARLHSEDMAARNYFAHEDPEGKTCSDRLSEEGVRWSGCGENIAAGTARYYGAALWLYAGWVDSANHRSNMLKPGWEYLGCGSAYNPDAEYQFYASQNYWY